jgi:P27 family predicted phage terminase small subunit
MARKGPRSKPTHLKIIEGNPGKRRLDPSSPKLPPDRPIAPVWLSEDARAEWRFIVPKLDAAGLVSKIDRTTLAVYCEMVATFREATNWVRERGILVAGQKGGAVKNPALQIQRDAARLISTYARMFGFSPADRVGMDGGALDGDAAAALAQILAGDPND